MRADPDAGAVPYPRYSLVSTRPGLNGGREIAAPYLVGRLILVVTSAGLEAA
jgi:hypothetical protein